MNFTEEIKKEILEKKQKNACCSLALLYGLICAKPLLILSNKKMELCFHYNEVIHNRINKMVLKHFGKEGKEFSDTDDFDRKIIGLKFDSKTTKEILTNFGLIKNGKYDNVFNLDNFYCENCVINFLYGMFIGTGYSNIKLNDEIHEVTSNGYKLEFVFDDPVMADELEYILGELGLFLKKTKRNNKYIRYFSNFLDVRAFFGMMDLHKCLLKLESENTAREMRKEITRELNSIRANSIRNQEAAKKQMEMILKINESIGLNSLPQKFSDVCKLRLQFPDDSLEDLAKKLKISKSGLNHRFTKIEEIANSIDK